MSNCPNCKNVLTCGCQKRTSSKGVAGCSKCIGQLNAGTTPQRQTKPLIKKNAPTNVTGVYKGPGTQI